MDNLEIIKTFPFLKPYTGKKDGKNQLMIRTKFGTKILGKRSIWKVFDLPVISSDGDFIKITKQQFKNIRSEKEIMQRYYDLLSMIERSVFFLNKEKDQINSRSLYDHVYKEAGRKSDSGGFVDNEFVRKFLGGPVPENLYEMLISESFVDEFGEPLLEEDVESIAENIESEYYSQKRKEEIEKMDFNERYKNGHYNKGDIFECFGFCWSDDPKTNEPLIADSYRSLLIRLYDYRYNSNPPVNISKFDDKWIENFLIFLIKEGYSIYRPILADPFNLKSYKVKFIKSQRSPYKYASFSKVVKHLKRYIFLLQKHNVISYARNPNFIDAKDYIGRKVKITPYTRQEHSLTVSEFKLLCETDFKDDTLNAAKNMFIIAVLGGGFRGEELFNNQLTIEERDGFYVLQVYHSKTQTTNVNPCFGPLKELIKINHGKLPQFLSREVFRQSLKKIAEKLNFDRIIISPNTYINSDSKQIRQVLKDIFSIYFARKTFVTLLDSYGFHDEDIIEFTSHSKTDTLKHYKGKLSLQNKISKINEFVSKGLSL